MRSRDILFCLTLSTLLSSFASAQDFPGVTKDNIYQMLWDVDDNELTFERLVEGVEPTRQIVLDQQKKVTGGRNDDASPRPLFRHVDETRLSTGCYPELIALFDNYEVAAGTAETDSPKEKEEIAAFIDKAMRTRPMKLAYQYVTKNLKVRISPEGFRDSVEKMWFELYADHYGTSKTPDCSGFEHVFVGEGRFQPDGSSRKGEVGGYHSWVRFYLEEKKGTLNYFGSNFDLPDANIPLNPSVITLRMTWNYDPDGTGPFPDVELFKPKGGFFVGSSPECELAIGTVAFYELKKDMLPNDIRRTTINGATYDLVLHPETKADKKQGDHIRTFYPVLVGYAAPSNDEADVERSDKLIITRALPNPAGNDQTGEWVELKNISPADINLDRWKLADRQDGVRALTGNIAAGKTIRFDCPRDQFSIALSNNAGVIRLFDSNNELIDQVRYPKADNEEILDFTLKE